VVILGPVETQLLERVSLLPQLESDLGKRLD